MGDSAICVDNISKAYRIGLKERSNSLAGAMFSWIKAPIRNYQTLRSLNTFNVQGDDPSLLWALKDVSFEIKQGDVVGIIGRNGAGKSTLLKILSRITEPTFGKIGINGRVSSLLEVGTGFHPEMTGRENVYMNGTILGMTKKEIDSKFDEIIDFSGVERFIDTPLKRYSSGMAVRLAFSVAAHLEPEILIIDEVLAVGDVEFQKKCLGKMNEVARGGRTVLFVSHNIPAVRHLCDRGIMLMGGRLMADGPVEKVINEYISIVERASEVELGNRTDRKGWGETRLQKLEVYVNDMMPNGVLITGQPARFVFSVNKPVLDLHCSFTLVDVNGNNVARFDSSASGPEDATDAVSETRFECFLDELTLLSGRFHVNVELWGNGILQDFIDGAAFFEVEDGSIGGRLLKKYKDATIFYPHHKWILPNRLATNHN